jgi:photosystem II stability/assembly factor-like uncharacterized protein
MLLRVLALSILPFLAAVAQEGNCWLRDAATIPGGSAIYALCDSGTVLVTTDGGTSWSRRETKAGQNMRSIAFIGADRGFVVGDQGTLLATSDGGKTWQPREAGTKENLIGAFALGDLAWVAGYGGTILHSADGGNTWTKQPTSTGQPLENIFFTDPQHGWAVGWVGTILRTEDGGQHWNEVKSAAATWSLSSVYFRDPRNGWAVGFSGLILHSTDGGITWKAQTSPVAAPLASVRFDKSNCGWIAFDDGFLVSEDGGETWKARQMDDSVFLTRLIRIKDSLWAMSPFGVFAQAGNSLDWKRLTDPAPQNTPRASALPEALPGETP